MSTVNNYIYNTIYNKLQIKLIFCNILHDSVFAIAHTFFSHNYANIYLQKWQGNTKHLCKHTVQKVCPSNPLSLCNNTNLSFKKKYRFDFIVK